MAKDYTPVWFNKDDMQRYSQLGISTVFKDKVKQLFREFCEVKEIEKITERQIMEQTKGVSR